MDHKKILTINAGSSSLKVAVFRFDSNGSDKILSGHWDKHTGKLKLTKGKEEITDTGIADILEAVKKVLIAIRLANIEIDAVGNRVTSGANLFESAIIVNSKKISRLETTKRYAPLHNPVQIEVIKKILKETETPVCASFDTSFFRTLWNGMNDYAIPAELLKAGIHRYGAHGLSHKYMTETMEKKLGRQDLNLITCHLGSGASVSAIKAGVPIDTSMGVTPLEGLVMGTRCGSIDPAVIPLIMEIKGIGLEKALQILNEESGLKALIGSSDFRKAKELYSKREPKGIKALHVFVNSLLKNITNMLVSLRGEVDYICLAGGIGENDPDIEETIRKNLDWVKTNFEVVRIDTDEEKIIAQETFNKVFGS